MNSAEEKDLHIYLDSEGAFEEKQACLIIYQVLKAIEFLHSKNVLHLDIKVNFELRLLEVRGSVYYVNLILFSQKMFFS